MRCLIKKVLIFSSLVVMISCTDSDTTKDKSLPTTSSTIAIDISTTTSTIFVDTSTTTVLITAPEQTTTIEVVDTPVTVPQEPILCERYSHPLHHYTCSEADAIAVSESEITDYMPTPSPVYSSDSELQNCIARYESENGSTSSNVYQFEPGTWEAYGGTGSAETAPMSEQNEVFDRAWADGGEQHWAAQSGRCF